MTKIAPSEQVAITSQKPRSKFGRGFLPLNFFIVSTMSILILWGCLFVWVSSYTVSEKEIQSLTSKLISESGQKIISNLDQVMMPLSRLTKMLAKDYNTGVATIPTMRTYLFSKFTEFGTSGCGYFFFLPSSARFTYLFAGTSSNPVPAYTRQTFGYPGTIRDTINITTGAVVKWNSTVDPTPYKVEKQDFTKYTMKYYNERGLEGVYGDPYKIMGGTVTTYYSQLIYDQELYMFNRTKKIVGLAKVNLSLDSIVTFLSKITLLGKGYVIAALNNGVVIGGSLNVTTGDGLNTTTIFEIKDRNAGELIKQFYSEQHNISSTPIPVTIASNVDGTRYIITPYKYRLENMEWNIFFVLYESDVSASLVIITGISVGVTCAVILLGIITSLVTGMIVSRPMTFLKQQFEKIKVLDLDDVSTKYSMFKEVNSIFKNLNETVQWLKQIKSFLPDHIIDQLQSANDDRETINHESSFKVDHSSNSSNHSTRSVMVGPGAGDQSGKVSGLKKGNPSSLFKMGFTRKGCGVIHARLDGLLTKSPEMISEIFKEYISILSPIIKIFQGNLQVSSCEELQITITSTAVDVRLQEKTFDCAIKLMKSIDFLKRDITPRIGVCIGYVEVGNVGNSTARYFSMLGDTPDEAKTFSQLASKYGVKILCNEMSVPTSKKLITRPLDRLSIQGSAQFTILQVINKKNEENEEWLYELEHKKLNEKYADFWIHFEMFQESYWNSNRSPFEEIQKTISILEKIDTELNHCDYSSAKLLDYLCRILIQHENDREGLINALTTYSCTLFTYKLEFSA